MAGFAPDRANLSQSVLPQGAQFGGPLGPLCNDPPIPKRPYIGLDLLNGGQLAGDMDHPLAKVDKRTRKRCRLLIGAIDKPLNFVGAGWIICPTDVAKRHVQKPPPKIAAER